jgi:single-strand DNA-binding protein
MAKSINKVILLGNVGKDPEIRALPSGVKVATLTLATSDSYKDKSGEWKEKTEWHTLVGYARIADVIEKYVQKGSKLYVEGKSETHSWEDSRSGEKKYQVQVKIEELILVGAAPNQSTNQTTSATRPSENDDWNDFR